MDRFETLVEELKKHPGEMYVTDTLMATMREDGLMITLHGDFKGMSDEELNEKFQEMLKK